MKKLLILIAGFLLLNFGTALSFPLYPGFGVTAGTQFEDDNLDFWVDYDGDGDISDGDVLYSAIEFTKIYDLNVGGSPEYLLDGDKDELVALAVIEVDGDPVSGSPWNFKQHGAIDMVRFYTGGTIDLSWDVAGDDPTLQEAIDAIVDGTLLWSFSITADPDTYWSFTPIFANAADPLAVKSLPNSQAFKVGIANYQLNQTGGNDIFNQLASPLGAIGGGDGLIDLTGSGDILGGAGLTSGGEGSTNFDINHAFARSDVDVLLNPVPEPATMSLFGLGLLGLAAISRRRK